MYEMWRHYGTTATQHIIYHKTVVTQTVQHTELFISPLKIVHKMDKQVSGSYLHQHTILQVSLTEQSTTAVILKEQQPSKIHKIANNPNTNESL